MFMAFIWTLESPKGPHLAAGEEKSQPCQGSPGPFHSQGWVGNQMVHPPDRCTAVWCQRFMAQSL